jgi:hypothetical protein
MEDAMSLDDMLQLSWTWDGPRRVESTEDGSYYEIRVKELPEFFVAGATADEVIAGSLPALRSFLQSFIDHGEQPPLPAGRLRRWLTGRPTVRAAAVAPRARAPTQPVVTG